MAHESFKISGVSGAEIIDAVKKHAIIAVVRRVRNSKGKLFNIGQRSKLLSEHLIVRIRGSQKIDPLATYYEISVDSCKWSGEFCVGNYEEQAGIAARDFAKILKVELECAIEHWTNCNKAAIRLLEDDPDKHLYSMAMFYFNRVKISPSSGIEALIVAFETAARKVMLLDAVTNAAFKEAIANLKNQAA